MYACLHTNHSRSNKMIYSPRISVGRFHITLPLASDLLLSIQRLVNPFNDVFPIRVFLEDRQRPIPPYHKGVPCVPGIGILKKQAGISWLRRDDLLRKGTPLLPLEPVTGISHVSQGNRLCQRYEERVPYKFETPRGRIFNPSRAIVYKNSSKNIWHGRNDILHVQSKLNIEQMVQNNLSSQATDNPNSTVRIRNHFSKTGQPFLSIGRCSPKSTFNPKSNFHAEGPGRPFIGYDCPETRLLYQGQHSHLYFLVIEAQRRGKIGCFGSR